jgi:hypothetical protein
VNHRKERAHENKPAVLVKEDGGWCGAERVYADRAAGGEVERAVGPDDDEADQRHGVAEKARRRRRRSRGGGR